MLSLVRLANGTVTRRQLSLTSEAFKGHSKWDNIKGTKSKLDQEKSQKTNELLKKVSKAVTEPGGIDLKLNKKLADVQLEFKKAGLTLDTFNTCLTRLKSKKKESI